MDNKCLSADAQGKICLWDMKKTQQFNIAYTRRQVDIQALQFVQRGLHILAVSQENDNQIKLWRWHNRPHLRWLKHLKATDEKNQADPQSSCRLSPTTCVAGFRRQ